MPLQKKEAIREGKSKILYTTEDPQYIVQYFKDDATAFNALKKGQIKDKGPINNSVSWKVFKFLEKHGVQTHLVEKLSDREMLTRHLDIIPVEVVLRNRATGSICKRLGIEKGKHLTPPLVEFFYKSDELGDPLIGEGHIAYFKWATKDELSQMVDNTLKVNEILRKVFADIGLELIDFKLEFGRDKSGKLYLADEFTADGCRLWDLKTGESMDKDRFRQDLGGVDEAYLEVSNRLQTYFEGKL